MEQEFQRAQELIASYEEELRKQLPQGAEVFDSHVHLGNDIGEQTYEEIDDGLSVANYGWPDAEGPGSNPLHRDPLYFYGREEGCALTAGTFYNPPVRPEQSNSRVPGSGAGTGAGVPNSAAVPNGAAALMLLNANAK